jgi:hypothetical protein
MITFDLHSDGMLTYATEAGIDMLCLVKLQAYFPHLAGAQKIKVTLYKSHSPKAHGRVKKAKQSPIACIFTTPNGDIHKESLFFSLANLIDKEGIKYFRIEVIK